MPGPVCSPNRCNNSRTGISDGRTRYSNSGLDPGRRSHPVNASQKAASARKVFRQDVEAGLVDQAPVPPGPRFWRWADENHVSTRSDQTERQACRRTHDDKALLVLGNFCAQGRGPPGRGFDIVDVKVEVACRPGAPGALNSQIRLAQWRLQRGELAEFSSGR